MPRRGAARSRSVRSARMRIPPGGDPRRGGLVVLWKAERRAFEHRFELRTKSKAKLLRKQSAVAMSEWIRQILESPTPSLVVLPAAALLGMVGAVTSCCNLAVIGAVAGYSGSLGANQGRRGIALAGLFFMVGTLLALAALGAVFGFAGKAAGATLGTYWKLVAGLIMVMFGLAALKLLPFKLPSLDPSRWTTRRGLFGSAVYGLAVGGLTTSCSSCCNPLLLVVLGYATVQGGTLWGAAVLATFSIGYSLPIVAAMTGLGLGIGRVAQVAQKAAPIIGHLAGILLAVVGFYLLATA